MNKRILTALFLIMSCIYSSHLLSDQCHLITSITLFPDYIASEERNIQEIDDRSSRNKIDILAYRFWKQSIKLDQSVQHNARFDPAWLETGEVTLQKERYFLGYYIPASNNQIKPGRKVILCSTFNVIYYIEKKSTPIDIIVDFYNNTPAWARICSGAVLTGISLLISQNNYNNYQDTKSSLKAEQYKSRTKTWFAISILPLLWTGWETYNYVSDTL